MTAIDVGELMRFVVAGATATICNLASVWIARRFLHFEIALLVGIVSGLTISFLMSKLFAFGSRSWARMGGELVRFLVVYAVGCTVYWGLAVAIGRPGLMRGVGPRTSEMAGVLVGAGAMMITTYLGHRFFTYKTHRRGPAELSGGF